MKIQYNNGLTLEAVLLSRAEGTMRVVAKGSDDVIELNEIAGTWVTDDCEPVQVEFAWTRHPAATVTEEDCICSHELAAHLIHLLYAGEEDAAATAAPFGQPGILALMSEVVS